MHVDSVSTHAPKDSIVVEDAHLLFTGGFKRTGSDLVISKDGHEVVVPDYFRGEKRAPLSSPDGAYLTGDIVNALAGHTQFAQADGSAGGRDEAENAECLRLLVSPGEERHDAIPRSPLYGARGCDLHAGTSALHADVNA